MPAAVWLGLLVLVAVELITVLVAAASPPAAAHGSWHGRAWLTLRGSPIALTIAALLGLVAGAYCTRRLALRSLAWRPGPIEVPDFMADVPLGRDTPQGWSAPAAQGDPPPIGRLSMLFRERLAAVHLQSPDGFPAMPESQDFLQLLTSAARTPANFLGTIAGLLTSMLPKSAYHVRGTLLRGNGARPFGVVVQVVTAPRYASPPLFFWDASWNAAVERAAYAVAAYLLPRTRACRQLPWTTWQGIELPAALVAHGTRAGEAVAERRYDQALEQYFAALAIDPQNLSLRLEIALLQEKLALWLDALATYEDLLAIAKDCRRRPGWRKRTRSVWRTQARLELLARYRRGILLSFGEQLARQWCKPATRANQRRGAERTALRRRLRLALEPQLDALAKPERVRVTQPMRELLGRTEGWENSTRDQVRLSQLFALMSQGALKGLKRRFHRPGTLRNTGGLTTRRVRISIAVADLRYQRSAYLLGSSKPRTSKQVKRAIAKHLRWYRHADWQSHYNAACGYAVTLLDDADARKACGDVRDPYDSSARDDFAGLAIQELEKATKLLDSGSLSRRRAWIVSRDPDLDGLRANHRFGQFEARFFPSHQVPETRPTDAQILELAQYTRRTVHLSARALADEWRIRAAVAAGRPAAPLLRQWLEEEIGALDCLAEVANDHEHWQTRARALRVLERWATAYDRTLPCLAYRDCELVPGRGANADPYRLADGERRKLQWTMQTVARECARLDGRTGRSVAHAQVWLERLTTGEPVTRQELICRERELWWDWLGDTLLANGHRPAFPHLTAPLGQ